MSELRGLRRRDVDVDERVIRVRRSADREGRVHQPKTRAGRREVPIPGTLAEILRERLADLPDDADAFVFAAAGARSPVSKRRVSEAWRRLRSLAGVRELRFHSLRGYFASCHAAAGTKPKELMAIMGHESIETTFAIYARVFPDERPALHQRADDIAALSTPALDRATSPPVIDAQPASTTENTG